MSCTNCYNNCDEIQSDKCVKYTGPDIACLGICTGDPLSLLESVIVDKLCKVLSGIGISLPDFTPCAFITTYLGGSPYLVDKVAQAFNDAICELKAEVVVLQGIVGTTSTFDTKCLTGLLTTRDQILQAVITKLCDVATDTATIKADYVKASELCTLVTACLGSGLVQEHTKMPKYCPIPYYGSLTAFDASGNGLLAFGYDKVYLCLGQTINGFVIPDMRGRVAVGANVGSPGGAMDAAVDPALAQNAGYGIAKGTKKGEFTHILSITEQAAHTHSVTDPGHTHLTGNIGQFLRPAGAAAVADYEPGGGGLTSNSNITGITIGNSGGNQPHNTVQPSIGTYHIIYVP